MQGREVSTENQAIVEFLKNFKYLNSKNKRAGFLLFGCSELTKRLEESARLLVQELNNLLDTQMTWEDKNSALITKVERILIQVRKDRFDTAPVNNTMTPYFMGGMEASYVIATKIDYDYKQAYADGKFEKNLLAGLEAADPFVDVATEFRLTDLIKNIKNHEPEFRRVPEYMSPIL